MAEEFRAKLERILAPKVSSLQKDLAALSLRSVLDHYQAKMDLSQLDFENLPDGFWAKWRYIWSLRLQKDPEGKEGNKSAFAKIDKAVEELFDLYSQGAIFEEGLRSRSEREFYARLGLALGVREVGNLAFPEQFRSEAENRFTPFDDSYFIPEYGASVRTLFDWLDTHIETLQISLNTNVNEFIAIMKEIETRQGTFAGSTVTLGPPLDAAETTSFAERLYRNGKALQNSHIYSTSDLQLDLPRRTFEKLLDALQVSVTASESTASLFPHSAKPLDSAMLIRLDENTWYFVDPALSFRVLTRIFESSLLSRPDVRDKYLRNRDRKTEESVAAALKALDPTGELRVNFYLQPGTNEKDIFFRVGNDVLLIECKNSRIRPFAGRSSDLLHFERDFKESVQFGFQQALQTKHYILGQEKALFLDKRGRENFSVRKAEISRLFILCITDNPRGPLGTDLSYFLQKEESEPFPLAMRLYDLETICKYFGRSERLFDYLAARQKLHGHANTGDELNYAGYYLRTGNLNLPENTLIHDDFSHVFDDAWYKAKGVDVESSEDPPFFAKLTRKGNEITFHNRQTGELMNKIDIQPGHPAHAESLRASMSGRDRNKPCPCGSKKKFKRCHGSF